MRKPQIGIAGGLMVALAAIAAGMHLEGGHIGEILQPTAAITVLGGTLGALLVQFPMRLLRGALFSAAATFRGPTLDSYAQREQILQLAAQARRSGVISLDGELKAIADPFLRRAVMLAVDGVHPRDLRVTMEDELYRLAEEEEAKARVWEAAGGYAPTVGILGAVLGLIQVMQRLDNINDVGRGIAVAFVATLYGVGLANLLLLPLSGKLRHRAREAEQMREATLEGVLSIVDGATPRALREKLGMASGDRAIASVKRMAAR